MSIFLLNVWQQITVLNTILLSYWLRAVLKIFIVFFVLLSHFIQNLWRFLHTGCLPEKTSSKPSQTLHIPKTEMSQMTPLIDCANLWQLYTLYCKSSLRWNYVREHTSSSISKVTRNCYIVEILFRSRRGCRLHPLPFVDAPDNACLTELGLLMYCTLYSSDCCHSMDDNFMIVSLWQLFDSWMAVFLAVRNINVFASLHVLMTFCNRVQNSQRGHSMRSKM